MTKIYNPNPLSEEEYNKAESVNAQMMKDPSSYKSNFGSYQEYANFVTQQAKDMEMRGALADKDGDGTGQPVQSFAANGFGLSRAMSALDRGKHYGAAKLTIPRKLNEMRSTTDRFANGDPDDDTMDLPLGPGFNYMTHLFKKHAISDKIRAQKEKLARNSSNIFTEEMDAVKSALAQMGIYSDKNPAGLPIDFNEAKSVFFGEDDIDEIKMAEWRTQIEIGDAKLDPKLVRKFVNYDGSLTWELLNQDKTVMSRFTLGDYNGTKIFAQGGYNRFAETLKKAKQKLGPNVKGRFDAIRGMFGG